MNYLYLLSLRSRHYLFFTLLLILTYWCGKVWFALPLRPQSLHLAAQCDRASIAQNFYEQDMNILMPRLNNMLRGTGIAAAEFPLLSYLAALCYKIFGFHDFWYRFIVFLFFSIGLFYAYSFSRHWLKGHWLAILCCILWACSPTLLYYTPNFNPDPASLGLMLIAWYLFFQLQQSYSVVKNLLLYLTVALSLLLKVTSGISVVCMCGLMLLDWLRLLSPERKVLIKNKAWLLLAYIAAALTAYSWYKYAAALNEKYYSGFFTLEHRLPENMEQVLRVWHVLKKGFLLHYYSPALLYFLALAHLLLLLLHKHIPRQLLLISFALAAGSLAFSYLMFVAFEYHDYYIIAELPWSLFVLLSLFTGLKAWLENKKMAVQNISYALCIAFTLYNLWYCFDLNGTKYDRSLYYDNVYDDYHDLEPRLRALGVKRDDLTVSISDWSYDVSLYLMNQKGFSIPDRPDLNRTLHYLLSRNAVYLVTNDPNCLPDLAGVRDFIGTPLLSHKHLKVYKPHRENKALADSLLAVIHTHIALCKEQFYNDANLVRINKDFSEKTGVPLDAAADDSGIYYYRLRESELRQQLAERFPADSLSLEERSPLVSTLASEKQLSALDQHILLHPYHSWFNHFR